jgi:hypothetical protein
MPNRENLTAESLQLIVKEIFDEYKNSSADALKSLLNVQNHFSNSYKARHFLELLQNSRDAIVDMGICHGKIKAWVDGNNFYFANNGKDFDRLGVRSICFTAISEKESIKFVGHKGIGFNSILEITDEPQIITKAGTICFDSKAVEKLLDGPKADQLPLFQFPVYGSSTIDDFDPDLSLQGFSTIFKFPLKESFKDTSSLTSNHRVSPEDLIFLGSIKQLQIQDEETIVYDDVDLARVEKNGVVTGYYRSYHSSFCINDEEFEYFDKGEKDLFRDSRIVQCRFLIKVDKEGKFQPDDRAKLHLYYAMDQITGFMFSIHSFFSVTLDRKRLAENSAVNRFLFKSIVSYYCDEFLESIKRDFPNNELSILAYQRKENNGLKHLYDTLGQRWSNIDFIYHQPSGKYLKPSEVYLVTDIEYKLFRNGFLGPMALIYISDYRVRNWLIKECNVREIHNNYIERHIEEKCLENQYDPTFFQELYELVESKSMALTTRKILLTQNSQIVSGYESQVYYQRSTSFTSPAALDAEISFIHPNIKIDKLREAGIRGLGIKEYSQQNLIDVAIKVLKRTNFQVPEDQRTILEIIKFISQFELIDISIFAKMTENIYLPVQNNGTGEKKWQNPLYDCIYHDDFDFAELYEHNIWTVDYVALNIDPSEQWRSFFENLGVWSIPGIYIIPTDSSGELTPEIIGDRRLHMPIILSAEFSMTILNKWPIYQRFICSSAFNDKMVLNGKYSSTDAEKVASSTVYKQLSQSSWMIAWKNNEKGYYMPRDVIVLDNEEFQKNVNQIWMDFFPIASLNALDYLEFCSAFKIKHFKGYYVEDFCQILDFFKEMYPTLDSVYDLGNFEKCFHRYLNFLSLFLQRYYYESNIKKFKEHYFLAKNLINGDYKWVIGQNCLLVDKKSILDKLRDRNLLGALANPYAFTKRDRNEWGRYAKDIGHLLSESIGTEMKHEGISKLFCSIFKHPEIIIAFVENDLDKHFTSDEILIFKNAEVFIHDPLTVNYKIAELEMSIIQDHYVSGTKEKTRLHLDVGCLNFSRSLSFALLDYFEQYISKELKRFEFVFEAILNLRRDGNERLEYAADKNIDISRIEDIGNLLHEEYFVQQYDQINAEPVVLFEETFTPSMNVVKTVMTKEVEIVEIESGLSAFEMMNNLDALVHLPISMFTHDATVNITHDNLAESHSFDPTAKDNDRLPATFAREISDRTKSDIGFYAEYYIYCKLQSRNAELLNNLNISSEVSSSIEWLNLHKISNRDLIDGSIGKGYDFYSSIIDLAIEVKGMHSQSQYFNITGPEFISMKRLRGNYYLIIVTDIYQNSNLKTLIIRDPYSAILSGSLKFAESKIYSPIII